MICRHTSRFPITGAIRKINENARPSGVGENSGKTKVHIISSVSNDNGALPLFRQSFCVHAHRLSFCRPGSLPSYHPLSLRSPGGAGILNLPLKSNFTKKFKSPLEIASHADYCKGKELENSDFDSGRCFRQGNRFPHLYLRSVIGLVEGCPRKDRRTTIDVFSTSASPFLCPRENGAKKQSITFSIGGNK